MASSRLASAGHARSLEIPMLGAVLGALWAVAPVAWATLGTCAGPGTPLRAVTPSDGTTGFPTNGLPRVFLTGDWPVELRAQVAREYRLVGEDGRVVPAGNDVVGRMVWLRPAAAFDPETTYAIEQAFVFRDGIRVDDRQARDAVHEVRCPPPVLEKTRDDEVVTHYRPGRCEVLPADLAGLERRWYPVATFRTGDGPDLRAPAAPVIGEISLQQSRLLGGGPDQALIATVLPTTEVGPMDLVTLEVRDQRVLAYAFGSYRGSESRTVQLADRPSCDPGRAEERYSLGADHQVSVRAAVITVSGRTATTDWTSVQGGARDWQSRPPDWLARDAIQRSIASLLAAGLADIPFALDERSPAWGPAKCRYGLVTIGRDQLPGAGPTPPVSIAHRSGGLSVHDRRTGRRWEVPASRDALRWSATAGPGTILVQWASRRGASGRWALLDADDGRVRAKGERPFIDRPRVLEHDGGFVLVWGSASLSWIGPHGTVSDPLPLPAGTDVVVSEGTDLIVAGRQPPRGIFLVRVHPRLRTTDAPLFLDAGAPSGVVEAVAARGKVVAVLWRQDGQGWMTVVDEDGVVAPPSIRERERLAPDAELGLDDEGFIATYAAQSGRHPSTIVERLACRPDPPPGPPSRLAP